MLIIEIILATIGVVMLVEGLIVALFPKETIKTLNQLFKSKQKVVKIGLIEMIIALAILLLVAL